MAKGAAYCLGGVNLSRTEVSFSQDPVIVSRSCRRMLTEPL